jgi:two-component system sensor histidine kinase CpxA
VPEAHLQDIFRPFFRVDEARERSSGGTGLGLSIVERAITSHGGTVEARNAAGGGLLVTVKLPHASAP